MRERIIRTLESIAGKENVSKAKPVLEGYVIKGVMELRSHAPAAVVRPKNVEEIRKILLLANREGIPVIPQSGGLSGGEATPMREGGILLDLKRMNRIIEVNPDARYMIVEPGVTSAQAWKYMQEQYPNYRPGIPDGAPPAASLIGDHIDRGFHFLSTRYGPAADDVLGLELILPTGRIVRTGSAALSTAKWFYRWMFGPDLTGLFLGSQGTMGVITKMAIKIFPMPKVRDVMAFGASDWEYLIDPCLDVLKMEIVDLAQGGNYLLATCRKTRYRWPPKVKPESLPRVWMNFELGAENREELENIKEKISYVLAKCQKEYGKKNLFNWELDKSVIRARLTKPNRISVPYAGHKGGGLLFETWYVVWKDAANFAKSAEDLMGKHKFSPIVWLAAIDHGRQGLIMPIMLFDPKSAEEIETVKTLKIEMAEKFLDMGGIPYRPDSAINAPMVMKRSIGYHDLLKSIKKILDPNGIMHPGRLALS